MTGSQFWGGGWWSRGQMLRAVAQPLLLFAQRNHFVAKLLVRRQANKPAVYVFGFDVGLDLVPVWNKTQMFLFVNKGIILFTSLATLAIYFVEKM